MLHPEVSDQTTRPGATQVRSAIVDSSKCCGLRAGRPAAAVVMAPGRALERATIEGYCPPCWLCAVTHRGAVDRTHE